MHEVRLALRALRATPVVSIVAVLSLALGIGANTAIFSLVNSVALKTLPVREPQALVMVSASGGGMWSWTNPIWEQIRARQTELFDGAMAWSSDNFDLSQGGETQFVDGIWASGGFFEVLGVPAMLGRVLTPDDDRRGGGPDGPVAVISHGFWQRRYGGAADVLGRSLTLNRVPFTIVGVTPPDFFGTEVGDRFDVVIPIGAEPLLRGKESALDQRSYWWLDVMMRLKPGQTLTAAEAALRGVQPQIREATLPTDWRPETLASYLKETFTLLPAANGQSYLRRRYMRPLYTLLVVVGLVLLVACANIANLLLARGTARRHELSVRLALGASRLRLARQLLVESLVLSGAGALVGLLFARWGSQLLVRQLSTSTNSVFLDLSLDWRVLAFTAAAAILTTLVFGTAPALRATRVEPIEALKEHGRGPIGRGRVGPASTLVVAQVALSLVLIVAAGLFVRTFTSLANLHLGFDRDRVLVVSVATPRGEDAPPDRIGLAARVREAATSVPGVAHAAVSVVTPVSGSTWQFSVDVPGGTPLPERQNGSHVNLITPGWFATYGTPLLAGRDFDTGDRLGARPVAIVNEAFARKFLNGANPIGHSVRHVGRPKVPPPFEIVGLAADAVYRSLRDPVPPTMYVPIAQWEEPPHSISLSVRAAQGSPALLARPIAAALAELDPKLGLTFRPLADQVHAALTQERLIAMLSGFFGALALLLAGLGLYGVTSYSVSRRRTELGIRIALGAAPAGVVRLVLARLVAVVAIGVVLGGVASWWAARFVGTLLYGLPARDPVTLVSAAVVLAGVGAIAGWLPARRAARIDPAEVLREG